MNKKPYNRRNRSLRTVTCLISDKTRIVFVLWAFLYALCACGLESRLTMRDRPWQSAAQDDPVSDGTAEAPVNVIKGSLDRSVCG